MNRQKHTPFYEKGMKKMKTVQLRLLTNNFSFFYLLFYFIAALKTEEEEESESKADEAMTDEAPSSAYWYFFDPNLALCGIHPYEPDLEPEEVRKQMFRFDFFFVFRFRRSVSTSHYVLKSLHCCTQLLAASHFRVGS